MSELPVFSLDEIANRLGRNELPLSGTNESGSAEFHIPEPAHYIGVALHTGHRVREDVLDMMVGFALLVVPWLGRNVLAFGTPLPSSVLSQAWLTDYADTFNYLAHPTWQTLLEQGWSAILAQRGEALLHNAGIFLLNTFPWGLLAIPGLWFLRREWAFFPATIYGLLLFLVTAILYFLGVIDILKSRLQNKDLWQGPMRWVYTLSPVVIFAATVFLSLIETMPLLIFAILVLPPCLLAVLARLLQKVESELNRKAAIPSGGEESQRV